MFDIRISENREKVKKKAPLGGAKDWCRLV